MRPLGTVAEPFDPFPTLDESKVAPSGLEQLPSEHTWNRTTPVSFASASAKPAVRVGVGVFSCAPSAGETSGGVDGARLVVLFVAAIPAAVTAALPVAAAVSRIIGLLPGFVY